LLAGALVWQSGKLELPTLLWVTPVVSPAKVTAAPYIYEGKQTSVPPPVSSALSKLNAMDIMATAIDDDVVNAGGKIPKQYEKAIPAAREAGLPCLVVMAGDKVVKIVKGPTTEEQVLGAVK
jgi:hypothetical protein